MRAALLLLVGACQAAPSPATDPAGEAQGAPAGWEPYDDHRPDCELYVPRAAEDLPPPIRWEPCRADAATTGRSCRQMALDWDPEPGQAERIAPNTIASRDAAGRILLHTARFQRDGTIRLVAEADGPVRIAIREQDRARCALAPAPGDGDHYAFRVFDAEATGQLSSYGGGAIGGRLDQRRPTALLAAHDRVSRSVFAGAPGLLELTGGGEMTLRPWDAVDRGRGEPSPALPLWSSARDGGLLQNRQLVQGDAIFWAADTEAVNQQRVWTRAGGVRTFLGFGDDVTRGVADLGTDGVDLVWLEGSGRAGPTGVFPDVQIMTSPFTTDPDRVEPRVIRSGISPYPFGTAGFVVGCGRAARTTADADGAPGTLLVRLADGATWHLPDGQDASWGWRTPLALTCDELFVRVHDRPDPAAPGHFTVARVKLDSLGPPSARGEPIRAR